MSGFDKHSFINLIKSSIDGNQDFNAFENKGEVLSISDGTAKISGMTNAKMGSLVKFSSGINGIIMGIEFDTVLAAIFGEDSEIKEGDYVGLSSDFLSVKVGKGMLSRVVDGIGNPIDGFDGIVGESYPVERAAPGIMDRKSVHEPLQTGILAIDALIPIGRGQRELIIGDRKTGKTTIAIDTILNQAKINENLPEKERVYSVYVAIGQKASGVAKIVEKLREAGAMQYTVVVAANASDPVAMQYFAPYTGSSIAEYFRDNGMHALIVFDDLSKHAVAYRQMSLLLKRPPAREAYPGDVFYIHSRLLERAAKLSDEMGAGSLTALPIIETQANDVSGFIPTNVISITDGQIFLESALFLKGIMPAINVGLSVSRVGSAAQVKAIKSVSGTLKLDLAQFRELEAFSQFASDLDDSTKETISRGEKLVEILKQDANKPLSMPLEACILYVANKNLISSIPKNSIVKFKEKLVAVLCDKYGKTLDGIDKAKLIDTKAEEAIQKAVQNVISSF